MTSILLIFTITIIFMLLVALFTAFLMSDSEEKSNYTEIMPQDDLRSGIEIAEDRKMIKEECTSGATVGKLNKEYTEKYLNSVAKKIKKQIDNGTIYQ